MQYMDELLVFIPGDRMKYKGYIHAVEQSKIKLGFDQK